MPDLEPIQTTEPPQPAEEATSAETSHQKEPVSTPTAAHDGIYAGFRSLVSTGDGQEPPPEHFSALLRPSELADPVNDAQRARMIGALQRQYGNRYVQRVLTPGVAASVDADKKLSIYRHASRDASEASGTGFSPTTPLIDSSSGQTLDDPTRAFMESRFGHDFSDVRLHTDSQAQDAASELGADAFTTGRDIYFGQGAYHPSDDSGRQLMAHELTHVVQQEHWPANTNQNGSNISQPTDPSERQAAEVSQAILNGEMFPPLASASSNLPVFQRQETGSGGGPAATTGEASAPGGGEKAASPAAANLNEFPISLAGTTVVIPVKRLLRRAVPGDKIDVPRRILNRVPSVPAFKLTGASINLDNNKLPSGATVDVALNIPPVEGEGSLTVDKSGNASGNVKATFSSRKIPGLKEATVDARVDKKDFDFGADVAFDLPQVSGNLKYKYENKKHSGKGKAEYKGKKLEGSIEIILSAAGKVSGSGTLEMELFKGLRGSADVAVDEKRNIKVTGKISYPGQIELFPEKKYEKNFFTFDKKFPIWGITIPVIDVNVGIFAEIHAGAGFRSKFGPGVLRDIALTGEFGTDPEAATEFGLGGEFYLPAAAEVVVNVGGGIGLGLAVADITGGIEALGVAGLYTALTVRPQFKYSGGKYTISGMAELAGVAQVKFGINAFAKIDVGVWLFKGTVWRRDWTLAEWIWNTGLNVALRANISLTLGEDFAPDISFETGKVDPEQFIKAAMPESGKPVPAPPKPPVPDKASFKAEGKEGPQVPEAGPKDTKAPTPGAAPAKTTTGSAPTPGTPAAPGPPAKLPPAPSSLGKPAPERTPEETIEVFDYDVAVSQGAPLKELVQRAAKSGSSKLKGGLTRRAARQKAKTHYYDANTDSWIPRTDKVNLDDEEPFELPEAKHEHLGTYESEAIAGGLDTSKGDARGDQRRSWISAGYPIPRNSKGQSVNQDNQVMSNPWQVDHIIELQAGGKDGPNNYQLLDSSANQSSGGTIRGFLQRLKDEYKTRNLSFQKVTAVNKGMKGPSMTKDQAKEWENKNGEQQAKE